jgi:hypothetical protein
MARPFLMEAIFLYIDIQVSCNKGNTFLTLKKNLSRNLFIGDQNNQTKLMM